MDHYAFYLIHFGHFIMIEVYYKSNNVFIVQQTIIKTFKCYHTTTKITTNKAKKLTIIIER
jgi:hypothetical protein